MRIAIYSGARSATPVREDDLTWPELCEAIEDECRDRVASDKRDLLALSPVQLSTSYRKAENVERVTALFEDFDVCDLDTIERRIQELGIAAVVYGSPSDRPDARRVRVVAPVTRPIAPNECRATRLAFAEELGHGPGCGAEGAADPAKIFFVGRVEGMPERYFRRFDGVPVDVDALDPPRLAWSAPPPTPALAAHLSELPPANAGIAAALGDWRAHAGRKWALCGAIGGIMRKDGYSAAECEAELRAWLPADEPGVDVDNGIAWALGAWSREPEEVSGTAELARLIGTEHAAIVCAAARAGTPLGRTIAKAKERAAPLPFGFVTAARDDTPSDALGKRRAFVDADTPIDYLCPGLRLAPNLGGKISLLAGLPGAAKGPTLDHIAVCHAFGLPVFGVYPCREVSVLVLDYEGWRLTMRRMARIARALGYDVARLQERVEVRDVAGMNLLADSTYYALEAAKPGLLCLDSYTTAMLPTGLDPNKIEFANFAMMLASLECATLVNAHANKAPAKGERPTLQQVSGSSALAALAQTGIVTWHPDYDKEPNRVGVACMRAPETGFESFEILFSDPGGNLALQHVGKEAIAAREELAAQDATTQRVRRVLEWLRAHPGPHRMDKTFAVVDVTGATLSAGALAGALTMLEAAGLVSSDRATRNVTFQIVSVHDRRTVSVVGGRVVIT